MWVCPPLNMHCCKFFVGFRGKLHAGIREEIS